MNYTIIKNNQSISLGEIPEISYDKFFEAILLFLVNDPHNHCVNYFGYPHSEKIKYICCIANDEEHGIYVLSTMIKPSQTIPSLAAHNLSFEKFEREIHENFGVKYTDHPWLKPVRYSFDRADKSREIRNYPFFEIKSEELHEVGVGPIHAGVIEPGHFRFICNGEQILHLEIQLGYQHRGIEKLFINKKKLLERHILAESIAGDTVIGHGLAFVNLWESLGSFQAGNALSFARTLALELERIASHTGDLSALCADIAYQLGSAVFGRLRTPLINFFQIWCGNRLGKGLIRSGKNNYLITRDLAEEWIQVLNEYEADFRQMCEKLFDQPSVLARFEKTGVLRKDEATAIGVVGMSARTCGMVRDIRYSHPHDFYHGLEHQPLVLHQGDVYARARLRMEEIFQSLNYLRTWLRKIPDFEVSAEMAIHPKPDNLCISLVEGWRGEICHAAITDEKGEIKFYKIKDPSFHNWLALALCVRNNEISDFPVCNKSFNLSYAGHDL